MRGKPSKIILIKEGETKHYRSVYKATKEEKLTEKQLYDGLKSETGKVSKSDWYIDIDIPDPDGEM